MTDLPSLRDRLRDSPHAVKLTNEAADAVEALIVAREVLQQLDDEWADALQADLENGVALLNRIASDKFRREYPEVSTFGRNIDRALARIAALENKET